MSKIAFCFPGQGSFEAGMGRDFAEAVPAAMAVFRRGSEASGLDLERLCFHADAEELLDTAVQQPALVATSLAMLAALHERGIEADFVIGHSVGEFAALAAAEAMTLEEAIALVRERGLAMADAAARNPGSMAAILGLADEVVEGLCRSILGVWPANYNCPGQIVVSGENLAVDECIEQAQSQGARRAVKLKVSGAFHSPLVARAADRLRPAIEKVKFQEPVAPFMSTVTARVESAQRMGPLLVDQLTAPVRFTQSATELMREGVRTFVEVGPGQRALRPRQADRPQRQGRLDQQHRGARAAARAARRERRDASARSRASAPSSRARRRGSAARSRRSSPAAGAEVVVGYRTGAEEAEALARRIDGRAVQADVSSAEEAARLVEEAGDLDILVNNAGLTRDGLLARMSDDDWRTVIETNLSSVFYTCRAVCRPMMKKRAGSIVNVSSIVGVHGNWGQTNYAASKAGIIGFTKSLARELGSRNVRANVVAPGYVRTQLTDVLPEEATAAMLGNTPLGRLGEPKDVAGRGTLPLLRRGIVHHGGRAARRRRTRDVVSCSERFSQRTQARRRHRAGRGDAARARRRVHVVEPARRRVRRRPDHALRPHRLPGALRLRGEGLRPDRVDRPQGTRGGSTASRT